MYESEILQLDIDMLYDSQNQEQEPTELHMPFDDDYLSWINWLNREE